MDSEGYVHVAPLQLNEQKNKPSTMTLDSQYQAGTIASSTHNPQSTGQFTPPLTPATSVEDLAAQGATSQMKFNNYLRAFYPFHPMYDSSSPTVTLPLNEGDIILIHTVHVNGWADGTLLGSGHRGWLPTNYCEAYDPEPIRNLMMALTNFYDVIKGGAAGCVAPFYNQDYTRGLIAGVRYLLVSPPKS